MDWKGKVKVKPTIILTFLNEKISFKGMQDVLFALYLSRYICPLIFYFQIERYKE